MKEKLKHYSKEIISFVIMLVIASNIVSYYRSMDLNKNNYDLSNIVLLDNKKFLYDNEKAILIHFWATWCPICKVEAPNIQSVSNEYQVLTIASDSGTNNDIRKYLKEQDVNFKVYNDSNYALAKKFNISVYPTTLIYDKDKNLVFSEVGYTSTLGLKLRMWWAGL